MALPPRAPGMKSVSESGMVVERFGGGGPAGTVVLVHGLGGPMMWERVVPLLDSRYDVVVPHLAGFGESACGTANMSSADHALLLSGFMGREGHAGVTLAGISYGGAVAAMMAAGHPDRVKRLVLICPAGLADAGPVLRLMTGWTPARRVLRRLLSHAGLTARASLRSFHDASTRPADLPERYRAQLSRPGHLAALVDALGEIARGGTSIRDLAPLLPHETVVAWGGEDRVLPVGRISGAHSRWFTDRLVLIPRCGHSVPLENPGEVARLIAGER